METIIKVKGIEFRLRKSQNSVSLEDIKTGGILWMFAFEFDNKGKITNSYEQISSSDKIYYFMEDCKKKIFSFAKKMNK
jgi:hypothetical protein